MRRRVTMMAALWVCWLGAPTSAAPPAPAGPAAAAETRVYIGTQGDGILAARLDPATGRLSYDGTAAPIARPTWLAVDPHAPILYSVSETGNPFGKHGEVASFAIDPASGALAPINAVDSQGGGATFVSYDPRSRTAFVGNFEGGQVASFAVGADGRLSPAASVDTDTGTGVAPKQNRPHAHGAVLDPGGRYLLTPDMGTDRIFVRRFDPATRRLAPGDPPFAATPPGSGPRHLVFSPDGRFVFVLTELAAEVRTFRWDRARGRLQPVQTVSLNGPDFTGTRDAADLAVSGDGRFLYVSDRATDRLLVYAVDRGAGTLRLVQSVASGGKTPRGFGLDPSGRWMVVGNQHSDTLTVFAVDRARGTLTATGQTVPVPMHPVAVAFFPPATAHAKGRN